MRRIVTAITASALALSLVSAFGAAPASAAVAGYDSAFSGESAFVDLAPGQSNTFQVFFLNTGTTTWTKGTATQIDLAACLEDKVTCNQQDASEAGFNPGGTDGWLSATRYATTVQASVAPGSVGNFVYKVTVPANATAGVHRFNGALVLASTGADIRNVGYFQDVNVTAGAAATLTSLDPNSGSNAGGTTVTITGTGFVCTPSFPTVSFGGTAGTVTSCGSTTLTVTSPAHANGAVDVTVTNSGAAASNALTYTYADTTKPTFDSIAASGNTVTLTFSEPVCTSGGTLTINTDISGSYNANTLGISKVSFSDCDATPKATATTAKVTVSTPTTFTAGDTVTLTITATGAAKVKDAAGNAMTTAQTRTATATADVTAPTASSAAESSVSPQNIKVTFSEAVFCPSGDAATAFKFSNTTTGASAVAATSSDCPGTAATSKTSVTLTFPASTFSAGDSGTLAFDASKTVTDASGNKLASFSGLAVTSLSSAGPTITDAKITTNAGFVNTADSGDVFKLTFSTAMNAPANGNKIRAQDSDGTIADITCAAVPVAGGNTLEAACSLDSTGTILTVTIMEDSTAGTAGATSATNATNLIALGTTAGLQWPATIIDTSGLTAASNNQPVNLSGSADKVIDVE